MLDNGILFTLLNFKNLPCPSLYKSSISLVDNTLFHIPTSSIFPFVQPNSGGSENPEVPIQSIVLLLFIGVE
jgi:hypothetical protein